MKTKLIAFNLASLLGLTVVVLHGQGNGPLLPSGPPADGVYRTLTEVYQRADQAAISAAAAVDSRIPISTAPFAITEPGSYYLATNLAVTAGDAITISANDVHLDLNGFTISSTANPAHGTAILLTANVTGIVIRNGQIRGPGTVSAGTYSGGGFLNGIRAASEFEGRNARIENLAVAGCSQFGIGLGIGTSTVVTNCILQHIGGIAIRAEVVAGCSASDLAGSGIDSNTVSGCSVFAQSGFGIFAVSVSNSKAEVAGGNGISAGLATNCSGFSASGIGLRATNAQNCRGTSTSGTGLDADNASNCWAQTTSGIVAMQVAGTATSCRAQNLGAGNSIEAAIAVACTTAGGPIVSPQKHIGTP